MVCSEAIQSTPSVRVVRLVRWAWVAGLMLTLVSAVARADVSGFVREQGTMKPIADALVTLQATDIRTTTDVDGSFSLPIDTGEDSSSQGRRSPSSPKGLSSTHPHRTSRLS